METVSVLRNENPMASLLKRQARPRSAEWPLIFVSSTVDPVSSPVFRHVCLEDCVAKLRDVHCAPMTQEPVPWGKAGPESEGKLQ